MKRRRKFCLILAIFVLAVVLIFRPEDPPVPVPVDEQPPGRQVVMEVTAYCSCQQCCGWKRNWLGMPVFGSGHLKGKRKKVGICADGTEAGHGTIAADTDHHPFGTRIYVPGYGVGTVHDRGSAIKGEARLDLFFKSHQDALEWGRQTLTVVLLDD